MTKIKNLHNLVIYHEPTDFLTHLTYDSAVSTIYGASAFKVEEPPRAEEYFIHTPRGEYYTSIEHLLMRGWTVIGEL